MGIVMEKIEPKRLVIQPDHHNYTLGGTAQYYAEIAVLHFGDDVVKVYEL